MFTAVYASGVPVLENDFLELHATRIRSYRPVPVTGTGAGTGAMPLLREEKIHGWPGKFYDNGVD